MYRGTRKARDIYLFNKNLKVAIVVDYLSQYGGAERVLESLLEIFPNAPVYTSIYDPSKFSDDSPIRKTNVRSVFDFGGSGPFLGSDPIGALVLFFPKHLTFVLPYFFERLNLAAYDLVISSGTIWAKGIKTNPNQLHVFYCHTPPRFLYGYPSESSKRDVWYYKPFVTILDHFLRIWDFNAAQRPQFILANSETVRGRIRKFYRRESTVIYPPVGVSARPPLAEPQGEALGKAASYFLIVSRLSAYKNIGLAIRAFNELKWPLKIVGVGREEKRLRRLAGPTVEFLGFVGEAELARLYQGCRAFIYTTLDEDFGITPLEANSFGKPVIALRSGGVSETQVEGRTALFYEENSVTSLVEALKKFDPSRFSPEVCIANAKRFSRERFLAEFRRFTEDGQSRYKP